MDRHRLCLSQVDKTLRLFDYCATATCVAGDVRPPSPLRAKSQRLRRRGPRSEGARIRRSRIRIGESPPVASGEPLASIEDILPRSTDEFVLLSINVRGFLGKIALLHAHLSTIHADIVAVQETWLDDSVEDLVLPGFRLIISRRDRTFGPKAGYCGIALYAREDVASSI